MLKYLLKFFLQNLSNPISITKVFNDIKSQGYSIGKNTVFDYVSHLEEAFVLFRADIWNRSARVQAVNPSKFYAIDPAFKYAMSISEDKGRVLENAVFLHLRRQGLTPHYFFEKQEVDFYWDNGVPVNVCLEFHEPATREREIKGLVAALQFFDLPEGRILTWDRTEHIQVEGKTIRVTPAWAYLLGRSDAR
ncbi:MAG: ATP-binding protein [Saprospiraceae bacterium]|nr:ATP-binding protein [Saprospiraceae bacterium]